MKKLFALFLTFIFINQSILLAGDWNDIKGENCRNPDNTFNKKCPKGNYLQKFDPPPSSHSHPKAIACKYDNDKKILSCFCCNKWTKPILTNNQKKNNIPPINYIGKQRYPSCTLNSPKTIETIKVDVNEQNNEEDYITVSNGKLLTIKTLAEQDKEEERQNEIHGAWS